MTTIGSKSRSNKDKSVDSEKSEARTTTMESWADAMQNQVTLRERKKLVKGYADFIGTSETVVESVRKMDERAGGIRGKSVSNKQRKRGVGGEARGSVESRRKGRGNDRGAGKGTAEGKENVGKMEKPIGARGRFMQGDRRQGVLMVRRWIGPMRERREKTSSVGDFPEGSVRVSERRKCERDSERCSRVSRDSSRIMVECLSRMIRASALPEPEKFDGKGDVKEFKRSFLLKYKAVTEKDADMVPILEDKFLKDAARTLFKTLPNRFDRSIESLFEEFEEKLRWRQGDREAEALNEFEELKRKPKQPMWEYLMDVEKWSKRAFPLLEEETMSQLRVTKLIRALREDPTMQKLMTMKRYEVAKKRPKRLMVIDSGAEVSVMSTRVWEALNKGCESWRLKGQLKIPIMVRGNKANVWFQLVEDRAEILLLGTNAFESIGVELAWKPKQEKRVKKVGKGPKAKWEENTERGKNNNFCNRKLMENGCGCQKGKCTVQEGDNFCSRVQQLGVVLSAKGKGAQVTTAEKVEASRKFVKECPEVVESVMKEGTNGEWEEAAMKIRVALKSEMKPNKTIIKEPAVIASPRLKISGRRNILEVRNSHGSDFMEKYEWKKVKNVLWLWRVTKDKGFQVSLLEF
ncbi:Protein CBG10256 [Caenorhabditis briggsae]|uniref:Protein CBG10256 n=1 Tax=Caenorhabditis briggsae TaxID=6238 RepID=A8XAR8_CAEBR|nr:Protein CBG10256 [Caenorhabditis briggsae]CAP29733.1 Protein CBG10256 [Caenorhabditis briggsae]